MHTIQHNTNTSLEYFIQFCYDSPRYFSRYLFRSEVTNFSQLADWIEREGQHFTHVQTGPQAHKWGDTSTHVILVSPALFLCVAAPSFHTPRHGVPFSCSVEWCHPIFAPRVAVSRFRTLWGSSVLFLHPVAQHLLFTPCGVSLSRFHILRHGIPFSRPEVWWHSIFAGRGAAVTCFCTLRCSCIPFSCPAAWCPIFATRGYGASWPTCAVARWPADQGLVVGHGPQLGTPALDVSSGENEPVPGMSRAKLALSSCL